MKWFVAFVYLKMIQIRGKGIKRKPTVLQPCWGIAITSNMERKLKSNKETIEAWVTYLQT